MDKDRNLLKEYTDEKVVKGALGEHDLTATEAKEARGPFSSLLCMGLAPGAKGSDAFLPSGVAPVFLPYITFDVIVRTESV